MHYTSILFDLDGTLLDTLGDLTAAMNRTLTRHGLPERTRQQMCAALGNGARRLMELSVPAGTDGALFETLLAEYNADYAAHCRIETAPYPGVDALLRQLLGDGDYWVRPPYGLLAEAEAAALTVPLVNWSVDTEDWRTKDSGKILDVIYRCTGDGDIVLLHDRYQNTVDAVLAAVAHLQEQGYVFVTVAELLALKGVAAEPGVTYRRA